MWRSWGIMGWVNCTEIIAIHNRWLGPVSTDIGRSWGRFPHIFRVFALDDAQLLFSTFFCLIQMLFPFFFIPISTNLQRKEEIFQALFMYFHDSKYPPKSFVVFVESRNQSKLSYLLRWKSTCIAVYWYQLGPIIHALLNYEYRQKLLLLCHKESRSNSSIFLGFCSKTSKNLVFSATVKKNVSGPRFSCSTKLLFA